VGSATFTSVVSRLMANAASSRAARIAAMVRVAGMGGGEGGVFVVVLAGGQAVVEAAEEASEQVALGGGAPVPVFLAPVVVSSAPGEAVMAEKV